MADEPQGEAVRLNLPPDRDSWEELERTAQRRVLVGMVERIVYDRNDELARLGYTPSPV